MREHSKKREKGGRQKLAPPAWKQAEAKIANGPLFMLLYHTCIHCDDDYPMSREDWAYVTSTAGIYLNPRRTASVGEWEYVISHCLLHLGFGHITQECKDDPLWNEACDYVVAKFLKDSHIGLPPPEFQTEFSCPVKDEILVYQWLKEHPESAMKHTFSTMTRNRADMRWERNPGIDFTAVFGRSLQASMKDALRVSAGLPSQRMSCIYTDSVSEARDWFISSYPLLGALAASFQIIDDRDTVKRMGVQVAAISPQLQEIYINPRCNYTQMEWRFILAHEFLHAALRHDVRCDGRNHELWNVACDFVVNGWLVEMCIGEMPEGALFDPKLNGRSVEDIYDELSQDIRRYTAMNPRDMIYGDETWWDGLDGTQRDAFYRNALKQGLTYHEERSRGYLPASLVEEIHAIDRPPIRWDVELARWFDEQFTPLEAHRTYSRMSRRQNSCPDIPRPAWHHPEEPVEQRIFGVLLDTSGSMERTLLAAALGAIASYSRARDVEHVRVVFCDATAYDQGIMRPDAIAGVVKVRGRGGTVLQPGIDLLDDDPKFPENAPLLIITDGGCDRLNLRGREHAYLIPHGCYLPFTPKGPVFRLK